MIDIKKKDELAYCCNCELIVPKKLLLKPDLKIKKIIIDNKWPCFKNDLIHYHNFPLKILC